MEMFFDDLENYTGDVWEVLACVYEEEDPWYEEGCVEQYFFVDEGEAREKYAELTEYPDMTLADGYSKEEGFDTLGFFLMCRACVAGHFADTYFSDDIVETMTLPLG